ncbi:Interleukin-17F [Labeo rohita]|uniref:Interleukin-17F n=1 Tax=Labeo rohita TaxID=84645 RepID=A0ABQ8LU85_LABRO|nr:Interleukin-17F [Labeo rohita]
MNATMSSALNIQFLMVACMMGLVLISFGAEGAPSKHPQKKGNHRYVDDESLFPSSIAVAKCSLTGCLIDGEDQDYQSTPIYTQIMVLRKIKGEKHSYSLKLEYKTIAVGCTCVRPYVQQI